VKRAPTDGPDPDELGKAGAPVSPEDLVEGPSAARVVRAGATLKDGERVREVDALSPPAVDGLEGLLEGLDRELEPTLDLCAVPCDLLLTAEVHSGPEEEGAAVGVIERLSDDKVDVVVDRPSVATLTHGREAGGVEGYAAGLHGQGSEPAGEAPLRCSEVGPGGEQDRRVHVARSLADGPEGGVRDASEDADGWGVAEAAEVGGGGGHLHSSRGQRGR
jgi:hypothetical protein